MAVEGEWGKGDGDILYASEINTCMRLVGAENSGTTVAHGAGETDITSVFTIPADSIITGVIITANFQCDSAANSGPISTFKIYADTSNPPTTLRSTQVAKIGATSTRNQLASVIGVITALTASSTNYIKITCTLTNTGVGDQTTGFGVFTYVY